MSFANTVHFLDAFEQLCERAHENSKSKGFWNPDPATGGSPDNVHLPTKFLLTISELCELFEAYRRGHLDAMCDKEATVIDPKVTTPYITRCRDCGGKGDVPDHTGAEVVCRPCKGRGNMTVTGVRRLTNEEEEMADVVIRVADYCGYRGIDLGRAILSKMNYNATRPHMHGGKTC